MGATRLDDRQGGQGAAAGPSRTLGRTALRAGLAVALVCVGGCGFKSSLADGRDDAAHPSRTVASGPRPGVPASAKALEDALAQTEEVSSAGFVGSTRVSMGSGFPTDSTDSSDDGSGFSPTVESSVAGRFDGVNHRASNRATVNGHLVVAEVNDGTTSWITSPRPEIREVLPAGKTAVQLPLATLQASRTFRPEFANPPSMVYLLAGANSVRALGLVTTANGATTHYSFSIDLPTAIRAAPAPRKALVQQIFTTSGFGQLTLTGEAWIDVHTGRIDQLDIKGALGFGGGSKDLPSFSDSGNLPTDLMDLVVSLQMTYGPQPPIALPAKDTVVDSSEIPGFQTSLQLAIANAQH